jgi:flavorubredoxin
MGTTSTAYGTRIDEIADGIYRIHTPYKDVPGGFSFCQFLVVDDEPLLFHTGLRSIFAPVSEAIAKVIPIASLEYVAFSHYESDECGSLNQFLAEAPRAKPVCSRVNAMINGDSFDRAPRALADGEVLAIGKKRLRWFDTPHLPHAWECGYLMEETTRTLLMGDLFTQGGANNPALTAADILEPSESFRKAMDYYSHTTRARAMLTRLAAAGPTTLATMHGSSWQGDGGKLLLALADALEASEVREARPRAPSAVERRA